MCPLLLWHFRGTICGYLPRWRLPEVLEVRGLRGDQVFLSETVNFGLLGGLIQTERRVGGPCSRSGYCVDIGGEYLSFTGPS